MTGAVSAQRETVLAWIERAYSARLSQGFGHDGARWDASDMVSGRMVELATRIAVTGTLPGGADTMTMHDLSGNAHSYDIDGVKAVLRVGNDFREACRAHRANLETQARQAETMAELDAIDIQSGWPGSQS